jgi:hypothetical protein
MALAAFVSLACPAAVYRCPDGSFQDKPCDKGDSKVITKRNTAGKPKPPDDACAALGLDAAEVARARAAGATSEALIAEVDKTGLVYAKKLERKKLIVDVFQKTGTPQEVGILFEADCAAAREQARKSLPATRPPQPAVQRTAAEEAAEQEAARQSETKARATAEEQKKKSCEQMQSQRRSVLADQRSGGTIARMEELNQRRGAIDKALSDAGCI